MTDSEIYDRFLKMEAQYDMFNWEFKDVPVWELLRFEVCSKLYNHINKENIPLSDWNYKRISRALYQYIFRGRNSLRSIIRNPHLLIVNHPRRKKNGPVYEDIYTDPILEKYKKSYVVIERYFSLQHKEPVSTKNLFYLDAIEFPARFVNFFSLLRKISKSEKQKLEKLKIIIAKEFDVELADIDKAYQRVVIRYRFLYPRLKKLVQKINPKKIAVVVSYEFNSLVLTAVAKEIGIPVYELQHGVVGQYHQAYNFPNGVMVKTFPDYFLSWGSAWTDNARLPIDRKKIINIGFPYLERFFKQHIGCSKKQQIVVISQMRMDLAKFTQELAHKLPQYTIIFKAHPSEYHFARQQYRFLTEISNVEIVDNDKISLYEYFSLSSILIGIHSTALIEGLAFDMKVLVLKYPGWECYKEYSKNNESLSFISDANEACLSIHNSYQSGSASTSIEPMFKENALENSLEIL